LTVAILASGQRFFVRPELVTYLMIALFIFVIHRYRSRGGRLLYLLPILQVMWTNSHTLFVFGPLLTGLLATVTCGRLFLGRRTRAETAELRRRARITVIVFGLTTLACLVNPYGLQGFAFPFQLFQEVRGSAFKDTIGEFRSPFSFAQGYTAVAYFKGLIAICVVSAALNLRRLDPFWTILVAAQLYLSSLAIRNVPLFAFAAVPFVVHNFRSSRVWSHRRIRGWLPRLEAVAGIVVVAVGLGSSWDLATNRFNVRQNDTNQFGAGLAEHRFPDATVSFLDDHGLAGPIFHTMREGAYLLAHGYRVFIDPRLEVYGEHHYTRYIDTVSGAAGWRNTLREYGVRVALLDVGTPLVEHMLAAEDWLLVHFDETSAVFVSDTSPAATPLRSRDDFARAVSEVRRRMPEPRPRAELGWLDRVESPKPYKRVGEFLIAAGFPDLSLPFFLDAVKVQPNDRDAYRGAVWALGYTGDRETATAMLETGLRQWPDDAWMQLQLGIHYFNAGRIEEASSRVEKSLLGDEKSAPAWSLKAQIHAAQNDYSRASRAVRRALELEPSSARYRKMLEAYQGKM
jgi:hypothetical protein